MGYVSRAKRAGAGKVLGKVGRQGSESVGATGSGGNVNFYLGRLGSAAGRFGSQPE